MTPTEIVATTVTVVLSLLAGVFKIWERARDNRAAKELSIYSGATQRDAESWARIERRMDDQDEEIVALRADNKQQREEIDGLYERVRTASDDAATSRNMFNSIKAKHDRLEEKCKAIDEDHMATREGLARCKAAEFTLRNEVQAARFVLTYMARKMGPVPDEIQRALERMPDPSNE